MLDMVASDQLVATAGNALLNSFDDGTLFKYRSLAITFCQRLDSIADSPDINKPTLKKFMVDDQLPRSTSRKETLSVLAGDYPVARGLVGVVLENVGVEICWIVRHGPRCRWGSMAQG